jgi:double-stranded uracil-DNA glycosylase
LRPEEYRAGMARVERLVQWLEPEAVCFVGLTGWRHAVDRHATAGPQDRHIGGRPVYVMPSTSGANAHAQLDEITRHLAAAMSLRAEA